MNNTKGFTLIELLIVVLIIGILTAIAVPKYQITVVKSRFSTMKDIVRAVKQAEQVYFLANGKYTPDIKDLDISYPLALDNNKNIFVNDIYCSPNWWGEPNEGVICWINFNGDFLSLYEKFRTPERMCRVISTNDVNKMLNEICAQETGQNVNYDSKDAYYSY